MKKICDAGKEWKGEIRTFLSSVFKVLRTERTDCYDSSLNWMKRPKNSSEELLRSKTMVLQSIVLINVTSFKKRLVLPCLVVKFFA